MNKQVFRYLHLSPPVWSALNKSNLAKLRKKTGYTFSNCKKALEQNDNDFLKAEKWLADQAQALGWAKAAKLEGRSTAQGLIGIAFDHSSVAMVEVNCETDFVARNNTFQNLVDLVANSCLQFSKKNLNTGEVSKLQLDGSHMKKLEATDKKSLEDHIALVISSVGENLSLRRATCVGVGGSLQLAAYTHPNPPVEGKTLIGKYGTVLVYNTQSADPNTCVVARQLCQHIVGMNPVKIGEIKLEEKSENKPEEIIEDKPAEKLEDTLEMKSEDTLEDNSVDTLGERKKQKKEEETSLMQQEFLMDPEISVGQLVTDTGINVIDFVRFECGESLNKESTPESEIRAQQVCG